MSIGLVLFSVRAPQWLECVGPHRHELCLCSLAHSNDSNTLTVSTLFIPLFTQKTLMFRLPVLGGGGCHISSGGSISEVKAVSVCVCTCMHLI